jgi:hypothetical protein
LTAAASVVSLYLTPTAETGLAVVRQRHSTQPLSFIFIIPQFRLQYLRDSAATTEAQPKKTKQYAYS